MIFIDLKPNFSLEKALVFSSKSYLINRFGLQLPVQLNQFRSWFSNVQLDAVNKPTSAKIAKISLKKSNQFHTILARETIRSMSQ